MNTSKKLENTVHISRLENTVKNYRLRGPKYLQVGTRLSAKKIMKIVIFGK